MDEKVTEIRADLVADVRKLAMLIQHHEGIAASMKQELANLLRLAHGINMNEPGTVLDAEGGVIVQRSVAPALQAVPTPAESVVDGSVVEESNT